MTYIVTEIQTNGGVTAVLPVVTYTDRDQAESKFHQILTAAALSAIEKHAAVLMTDDGRTVRTECYMHPADEPAEEQAE